MMLTCHAYAKVNLTLDILGQRPDGYHEVRTILQTIALHDTLSLERTNGPVRVWSSDPSVPDDEQNLVYRAAQAFKREKDVAAGVRVNIDKRIPVAAGLGGGSSNAAATLLALQQLWQTPLSTQELFRLGSALGSDIPFFFFGGAAIGVGRGSEVYPLPDLAPQMLLLVYPDIKVSATEAYAIYDRNSPLTKDFLHSTIPDSCAFVVAAWGRANRAGELAWADAAGNDLEAAVATRYPEIEDIVDRLRRGGAKMAMMSGSGSTIFAILDPAEEIERVAAEVAAPFNRIIRTRTVGRGEYWETLIE